MNNKEKILDCSLDLFFKHWFEEVSMNMIIEKSWVSKWWIYHYFISKEDILEKSLQRYISDIIQKKDEILNNKDIEINVKFYEVLNLILNTYAKNIEMLTKINSDKKYLKIRETIDKLYTKDKECDMNNLIEEYSIYLENTQKDNPHIKYIREKFHLLIFFIDNFWTFIWQHNLSHKEAELYISLLKEIITDVIS